MISLAAALMLAMLQAGGTPAQASAPADLQVGLIGPGIGVADVDRSLRFYRDGLGLRVLRRLPNPHGEEVMLGFGNATSPLLVLVRHAGAAPAPRREASEDKIMLSVGDADRAAQRLSAAGFAPGAVQRNARMGVATFWISDPDGHRLEIVARTTPSG